MKNMYTEEYQKLFDPNVLIEDDKVKLRVVSLNDIKDLLKIVLNDAIWQFYTIKIDTIDELTKYVQDLLFEFENKRNVPFVIIDKENDSIVGMTSYGNISLIDKRIEIGWSWLGVNYHGVGINKKAKQLLLKYAFETLHFTRVEFKTDVLNSKAKKALLKIGAVEEGVLRSHTQMHSNRRRDTIYYSILINEWKELQNELS